MDPRYIGNAGFSSGIIDAVVSAVRHQIFPNHASNCTQRCGSSGKAEVKLGISRPGCHIDCENGVVVGGLRPMGRIGRRYFPVARRYISSR